MDVTEFVKKSLAFGMGAASFSVERIKQFADDMVARGEMSSDDAHSFVDEVSKRAEADKQSIQEWISDQVAKMVRQTGLAEAQHVERLEARVTALETLVAELSPGCGSESCRRISTGRKVSRRRCGSRRSKISKRPA